jgi:hypothetical protein
MATGTGIKTERWTKDLRNMKQMENSRLVPEEKEDATAQAACTPGV